MYQVTIRPVHRLFLENSKPDITVTELMQLRAQLQPAAARKTSPAAQRPTERVRKKQLACVQQLQPLFARQPRQSKTVVAARLDEILTDAGFKYERKKHAPARAPRLWGAPSRCYDLAFYSPAVSPAALIESHHSARVRRRVRPDLFYMRCEEHENMLLIGNLQIDAKARDLTRPDHLIMTAGQNIQRAMVHHAVRYGLEKNFARILLHAGDSACQAQFGEVHYRRVLITPENFAQYDAAYQADRQREFETLPGDRCCLPADGGNLCYIVRAVTPTEIICAREDHSAYNLVDTIVRGLGHFSGITTAMINTKFKLEQAFDPPRPAKVLEALEKFIEQTGIPVNNTISRAEKIKWLTTLCAQFSALPGESDYDRIGVAIGKILRKWNYEQKLLRGFPGILKPRNSRTGQLFYIDTNLLSGDEIIDKAPSPPPVVGEYYLTRSNPGIGGLERKFLQWDKHYQIFNWYDCRLPEVLHELGLGVERVPVPAGPNGAPPGTAWEIRQGQEEFQATPLACF